MKKIGLGDPNATLNIYIENIPPLEEYQTLSNCRPIENDEIKRIADLTGNHWRKIFNVYAKIIFELSPSNHLSWQVLREKELLQKESGQSLLFSSPHLNRENSQTLSIVMGKTYATRLGLVKDCYWSSHDFAINKDKKLIICPYFDYRQLSNIKITQLCQFINALKDE